MNAMTYSAARANLASTMDRVCDDHEAVIITRSGQRSVVIMSLEDYQSMEESMHLLRSPTNAKRLLDAIDQLASGGGQEKTLSP